MLDISDTPIAAGLAHSPFAAASLDRYAVIDELCFASAEELGAALGEGPLREAFARSQDLVDGASSNALLVAERVVHEH